MEDPKYRFQNLAGMSEDGLFYLEGFDVRKYNGKNILESSYAIETPAITAATPGFTNIGDIYGMTDIYGPIGGTGSQSAVIGTTGNRLFVFTGYTFSGGGSVGEIHQIVNGFSGRGVDVILSSKGNILYSYVNSSSSKPFVGIGYVGEHNGSNETTKLIDKEGRNWTTLGIDSSNASRRKVFNLTRGVEYVVTSISTTSSTNDTLNFTAVSGKTNEDGDMFVVFYDDKFDLSSGATYPHYKGQYFPLYWRLQFCRSGVGSQASIYVTNGNYLSNISFDDATVSVIAKQLPARSQAMAISMSGGQMITSVERSGDGILALSSKPTDTEFASIIEVDSPIYSILPYNQGWMFVSNGQVYITDGYQVSSIGIFPECQQSLSLKLYPYDFCKMDMYDGELYILTSTYNHNRYHCGLYIFNPVRKDWRFVRIGKDYTVAPSGIYINTYTQNVGGANVKIFIYAHPGIYMTRSLNAASHQEAILYGAFNKRVNISKVRVNIAQQMFGKSQLSGINYKVNLSVLVSDGKKQPLRVGQVTVRTDKSIVDVSNASYNVCGVVVPGNVVKGYQGIPNWSVVQTVTDPGTANEVWTLSPEFATKPLGASYVQIIDAKYCGTKEVDVTNMNNKDYFFDIPGFESDKIYIFIMVDQIPGNSNTPIGINSVELY